MSRYKSCAFAWACLLLAADGAPAQPGWKPDRPVWRMITAPPGLTPSQLAYWQDALRKTTESPEWKKDLEMNYQSDEFMAGTELAQALEGLYVRLKGLLTDLDLAKKP